MKVLSVTEHTGPPQGNVSTGISLLYVPIFKAGAVLTLQCKRRTAPWVDTDITVTKAGMQAFFTASIFSYRLVADKITNVGSEAYIETIEIT